MLFVEYLTTRSGAFLRLRGQLNHQTRDVLFCMLEQAVRQGARHAVVDLSRTRPLDSSGREALDRARQRLEKEGLSLALLGAGK